MDNTNIQPVGSNVDKYRLCLEIEKFCKELKKSKLDLSKIKIVRKL